MARYINTADTNKNSIIAKFDCVFCGLGGWDSDLSFSFFVFPNDLSCFRETEISLTFNLGEPSSKSDPVLLKKLLFPDDLLKMEDYFFYPLLTFISSISGSYRGFIKFFELALDWFTEAFFAYEPSLDLL